MTPQQFQQAQTTLLLNNSIPEQLWPGFISVAWDRGHAYGYDEMINELTNLIHSLKPGIHALMETMWTKVSKK